MQVRDDVGPSPELDLRYYLSVIRRRRWLILTLALVIGLGAMGWAMTKPDRYRATAQLLLLAPTAVEAEAQSLSNDPDRAVANEIEILGSLQMQQAVAEVVGEDAPEVTATPEGENDVVALTAESTDPEAAQASVNAYAHAYERLRRQRTVQALQDQLERIQEARQAKQATLETVLQPFELLNAQVITTPPGPEQDALIVQRDQVLQTVSGPRDAILEDLGVLDQDIEDIQGSMQDPSGGVTVLNPAITPSEPYFPQPKKDLLVGLVVGLLLGLAGAFVREHLDDAIRSTIDVERAAPGLPVIGVIPRVSSWRDRSQARVMTTEDPHSPAAEAYRGLVTSLEFLATGDDSHVILFTSAGASEGKSTTVANLGIAFGEAGHRTAIVDGDLRRPRLHDFFGLSVKVGLSKVLAGRADIATVVRRHRDVPVGLVPVGPVPPNPSELLRTDAMETAIMKLREDHDFVLIDSPPALPVADALVLARHADTVLLIVAAEKTSGRQLRRAVEALTQVSAPLEGFVLNGIEASAGYEYGYYGPDEGSSRWLRRRSRA